MRYRMRSGILCYPVFQPVGAEASGPCADGERKDDHASAAVGVANVHLSLVASDDLVADCQTNAGTEGFYFYATDEDGAVILNAGSRYTIEKPNDSIRIPDGYFKTSILISGHTVTAYSPTEDLSGDFLLLILSRNGKEAELYSFDRVEKTLQRYSSSKGGNTIGNTASGYSTIDEQELVAGYEKSLSSLTLVIAILSGVCMLLLILTIRMALKSRKAGSAQPRKRTSSGTRKPYGTGSRNSR